MELKTKMPGTSDGDGEGERGEREIGICLYDASLSLGRRRTAAEHAKRTAHLMKQPTDLIMLIISTRHECIYHYCH